MQNGTYHSRHFDKRRIRHCGSQGHEDAFQLSRCFAFDKGVHDRRCLAILGEYLKSKNGLALYRSGRFFDYLLDNVHDLKNHVKAVIEDNASGNEARGIKSISPDALPRK